AVPGAAAVYFPGRSLDSGQAPAILQDLRHQLAVAQLRVDAHQRLCAGEANEYPAFVQQVAEAVGGVGREHFAPGDLRRLQGRDTLSHGQSLLRRQLDVDAVVVMRPDLREEFRQQRRW